MVTTSLVTMFHHTMICRYYRLCPCAVHFIAVTHLSCTWKFVSLNLLHLFSHLPTSSLLSAHGHLSTISHLPPVFTPPAQREEPLEGPGKAERQGVLTTMWLMETQQSGGKSCSMGTRNCRQPSQ